MPEKCDLNSILFLMTPAEDESKLNTLVAKLVKFKNLWDRDAPLAEVLPTRVARRTASATPATRCGRSATRCTTSIARRTSRSCSGFASAPSSFPELAMTPQAGLRGAGRATRSTTCRSTSVKGRISATLALIYPPGIGVIVPGERWDERAKPMRDYFLAFQESFNRFPGFNYEVQGVFQERVDGRIKFHTYVVRE